MPQVSEKMLTQELRELERYDMIERTVKLISPPTVEYGLTEVWYEVQRNCCCGLCVGRGVFDNFSRKSPQITTFLKVELLKLHSLNAFSIMADKIQIQTQNACKDNPYRRFFCSYFLQTMLYTKPELRPFFKFHTVAARQSISSKVL